jgi:hypothetical protein
MPNIKFNYLYRDGSNYKNYGFVIFTTPDNIALAELEARIVSRLIDDTYFYAQQWQLPDLRFANLTLMTILPGMSLRVWNLQMSRLIFHLIWMCRDCHAIAQ